MKKSGRRVSDEKKDVRPVGELWNKKENNEKIIVVCPVRDAPLVSPSVVG